LRSHLRGELLLNLASDAQNRIHSHPPGFEKKVLD